MKRWMYAIVVGLEILAGVPVAADAPQCLARYTSDLAEIAPSDRRRILRSTATYSNSGREGLRYFLEYRGTYDDEARRLSSFFWNFEQVTSRFASREAAFEALARVHRRRPDPGLGIGGMSKLVAELGIEPGGVNKTKAALFELHYVDSKGLSIQGFRQRVNANGFTYEADHLLPDETIGEVKALSNPYRIAQGELTNPPLDPALGIFKYDDPFLDSLAEEATRLIIIRQGRYETLKIIFDNTNSAVLAQRSDVAEVLLKQFDTPRVKNNLVLRPVAVERQEFSNALNDILVYY